jgi:hypothetical protein
VTTDTEDVERENRPLEPLELELAGRLGFHVVLDLRIDALGDQDLTVASLVGEP